MSGISKRVSGSWVSGDYGIMKTATDTITTLPAVIYADGNNATVGISGNMEQNGAPTPQNPIQPSECGEKTENLFDYSTTEIGALNAQDGSEAPYDYARRSDFIPVQAGETYTFSGLGGDIRILEYNPDKTYRHINYLYTNPFEINGTGYIRIVGALTAILPEIMLNLGSTALPYEPYGYKIPISSASTTTPVYLGEVETTRKIKKYEFTGQEDWSISNNERVLYTALADHLTSNELICYCSHYKSIANVSAMSTLSKGECAFNNTLRWLYIKDDNYNDATTFKTYLQQQYAAGTPVTIWYVLATEEIAVVNEPIRKIGDYADTVSGITIPTIAGANTLSVDTTLQPSEVTANYHGWHTGAVHERDSGQWD